MIDDTWIDCPVRTVSARVANPDNWARWWPGLELMVTCDRGERGIIWTAGGPYRGSVEIWLEPVSGGVTLHHFLRLDPASGGRMSPRSAARTTRKFAWHAKRVFWALKDELEALDR